MSRVAGRPPSAMTALAVTVAGCLIALATGCSTASPPEPIGVNLVDLEVREVTLFEASLVARVRITNPGPEPLELVGGSLKMLLDGRKIGTALCSEPFSVPAFDSTIVDMSVQVNTASAITRLPKLLEQNVVSYGVRGAFYSEGTLGRRAHSVERAGSLDLRGATAPLLDEGEPPRPGS